MENQNNDAKLTPEQRMYQAVEDLAKEIDQRNVGKGYTTSTFPSREGIWSNEELSDEEELERAKQRLNYFHYSKARTNMSKEADEIMDKLKNGQPISREEEFTLICDAPEKVKQFSRIDEIKQKVKNGEQITTEELQFVTETTFGKNSKEGQAVYDKMIETGRVKSVEYKIKSDEQQKKDEEVTRNDNSEHQRTSVETGKNTQSIGEKSREDNEFIKNLKQRTYTPEEIAKNDVKAMEQPAIEQPVIQAPVTQGPELVI